VALPFVIPVMLVIVARLLAEEKFLAGRLHGYDDYRRNVRWRLLPGIW
jgi:protein-S-isoprenylcysteine O-methyltransferase Ste14